MKPMGHYRLASKEAGDDVTLTRYVRDDREKHKPKKHQPRFPGIGTAPFIQQSRTKFTASVKQPNEMKNLLVSGHSNVKIGRDVRKGKWLGYWIYTLSLEERKTCPSSCLHWQNCYGNNMPFAKRIDHTAPEFLSRLAEEIAYLCRIKYGVLIRLHALGDFYSPEYVEFWAKQLLIHDNLSIFGYTAHPENSHMGHLVSVLHDIAGERFMVRHSDGKGTAMTTVSIGSEASAPQGSVICPEQTGKVACCATCAVCWSTNKPIAFLEH